VRSKNRPASRFRGILLLLPVLLSLPSSAHALTFYVAADGSDARSPLQAQSPSTPWATINHALQNVASGHTILVQPGTYAESAESKNPGVTLRVNGAPGSAIVEAPSDQAGLQIKHADLLVEGLRFVGGTHGIRAEGADGLIVRGCQTVGQSANGITVNGTAGATVESSIVVSAGSRGIFLDHSSEVYVRNNLVYGHGEWGIDFDNENASDPQPPVSTGNVVAFNTVAFNGDQAGEGGIRLKNAVGHVRDNVLSGNQSTGLRLEGAGTTVHHNLVFGSPTPLSPADYVIGAGALASDPTFVDPDGADASYGGKRRKG